MGHYSYIFFITILTEHYSDGRAERANEKSGYYSYEIWKSQYSDADTSLTVREHRTEPAS